MKKYELFFGHFGNGYSVSNKLEEEHGNYKKIAHINHDRTITFYEEEFPKEIKERIIKFAKTNDSNVSTTQDQKIFSAPPILD